MGQSTGPERRQPGGDPSFTDAFWSVAPGHEGTVSLVVASVGSTLIADSRPSRRHAKRAPRGHTLRRCSSDGRMARPNVVDLQRIESDDSALKRNRI